MITDRDILILVALVHYYVLNRQQIQRLVFANDPNGRITRAAGCKSWLMSILSIARTSSSAIRRPRRLLSIFPRAKAANCSLSTLKTRITW